MRIKRFRVVHFIHKLSYLECGIGLRLKVESERERLMFVGICEREEMNI